MANYGQTMVADQQADGERVIEGWDTLFRALSAEPRRQIIVTLMDTPPDRELILPEAANPSFALRDPQKLYVELKHSHLPVLSSPGYVEWDTDPLRVRRGPNFEAAAAVFRALKDRADDIPDRLVYGCPRLEAARGEQL